MYKKAAQRKLRFETTKGVLSVEQLFDLPLSTLSVMIRKLNESIKKTESQIDELSFLDESVVTDTDDQLRFDILKDIYLSKKLEITKRKSDMEKKEKNQRILELIKQKQDRELESKSIEELKSMLED